MKNKGGRIVQKPLIVQEGYPFILVALIISILAFYFINIYVALFPFFLSLFFMYFFRNPKRNVPNGEDTITSPADGTVMEVTNVPYDEFLKTEGKKVVIFLSVFNVHVNRSPISGEIKYQNYSCGNFAPAYKKDVGFENERLMLGIEKNGFRITVTQIAGLLARRIVSWVSLNDKLEKGELYGMIKFGSCTEIVVPKNVEILVKKNDKVVGGETIIGRILDYEQ